MDQIKKLRRGSTGSAPPVFTPERMRARRSSLCNYPGSGASESDPELDGPSSPDSPTYAHKRDRVMRRRMSTGSNYSQKSTKGKKSSSESTTSPSSASPVKQIRDSIKLLKTREKGSGASFGSISVLSITNELKLGDILSDQEEPNYDMNPYLLQFKNEELEKRYHAASWVYSLWVVYISLILTIIIYVCLVLGRIIRFNGQHLNSTEDLLPEDEKSVTSNYMLITYWTHGASVVVLLILLALIYREKRCLTTRTTYFTFSFTHEEHTKPKLLLAVSLAMVLCDCVTDFTDRFCGPIPVPDMFVLGMIYWVLMVLRFPTIMSVSMSILFVIVTLVIDATKTCAEQDGIQPCTLNLAFKFCLLTIAVLVLCVCAHYHQEVAFRRLYVHTLKLKTKSKAIEELGRQTNRLLSLNLPKHVISHFKHEQDKNFRTLTELYDNVIVIFVSLNNVDFGTTPEEQKDASFLLNSVFALFDQIVIDYRLQKLKVTGGTKYMVLAGISSAEQEPDQKQKSFFDNSVLAAKKIAGIFFQYQRDLELSLAHNPFLKANISIGMNCGEVVTGIIGSTKFLYDAFGDAVNVASRMQSNAPPNSILIPEESFDMSLRRSAFKSNFVSFGSLHVKGKCLMKTLVHRMERNETQEFAMLRRSLLAHSASSLKSILRSKDSCSSINPELVFSTLTGDGALENSEMFSSDFELLASDDQIQNRCLDKIRKRTGKFFALGTRFNCAIHYLRGSEMLGSAVTIIDEIQATEYELENMRAEKGWIIFLAIAGYVFSAAITLLARSKVNTENFESVWMPVIFSLTTATLFVTLIFNRPKADGPSCKAYAEYLTLLESENDGTDQAEPGSRTKANFDFVQFLTKPMQLPSMPKKVVQNKHKNRIQEKQENNSRQLARGDSLKSELLLSENVSRSPIDESAGEGIIEERSFTKERSLTRERSSTNEKCLKWERSATREKSVGMEKTGSKREESFGKEESIVSLTGARQNSLTVVQATISNPICVNIIPDSPPSSKGSIQESLNSLDDDFVVDVVTCANKQSSSSQSRSMSSRNQSGGFLSLPGGEGTKTSDIQIEFDECSDDGEDFENMKGLGFLTNFLIAFQVHRLVLFMHTLTVVVTFSLVALDIEKHNMNQFTGIDTSVTFVCLIYLSLFYTFGFKMLVFILLAYLIFIRVAAFLILTDFDASEHILRFFLQLGFSVLCLWSYRKRLYYQMFTFLLEKETARAMKALVKKEDTVEAILLNILPKKIASKLILDPGLQIAENFDHVVLLNTDFESFTKLSSAMTAVEVTAFLNIIFAEFDRLCEVYGCEKLTTVGDAYVAASGVPEKRNGPLIDEEAVCLTGCGMLKALGKYNSSRLMYIKDYIPVAIRVGIHSGPALGCLIGGVMNCRYGKFPVLYLSKEEMLLTFFVLHQLADVIGATAAMCERFEQTATPNCLHISSQVKDALDRERPDFSSSLCFKERAVVPSSESTSDEQTFLLSFEVNSETASQMDTI